MGAVPSSVVRVAAALTLAMIGQARVAGQSVDKELRLLSAPNVRPQVRGVVYRQQAASLQPGLLVLHGSGGLGDQYFAAASELSRLGFVVLLVDLNAETGSVSAGAAGRLEAWPTWEATVRLATRDAEERLRAFLTKQLQSVRGSTARPDGSPRR